MGKKWASSVKRALGLWSVQRSEDAQDHGALCRCVEKQLERRYLLLEKDDVVFQLSWPGSVLMEHFTAIL